MLKNSSYPTEFDILLKTSLTREDSNLLELFIENTEIEIYNSSNKIEIFKYSIDNNHTILFSNILHNGFYDRHSINLAYKYLNCLNPNNNSADLNFYKTKLIKSGASPSYKEGSSFDSLDCGSNRPLYMISKINEIGPQTVFHKSLKFFYESISHSTYGTRKVICNALSSSFIEEFHQPGKFILDIVFVGSLLKTIGSEGKTKVNGFFLNWFKNIILTYIGFSEVYLIHHFCNDISSHEENEYIKDFKTAKEFVKTHNNMKITTTKCENPAGTFEDTFLSYYVCDKEELGISDSGGIFSGLIPNFLN